MPYRAVGTVTEAETGRPLQGLVVRAYDDDLLKDDFLGETRTDAAGRFEIVFTEVHFMDFHETRPDLYVRVYDESGSRLLLSLQDDERRDARPVERFEVRVPAATLRAS